MATKCFHSFLLISALVIGSSLFLHAQTQTTAAANDGGATADGSAGGDPGGAYPNASVDRSHPLNSVVVLAPDTEGAHWTDKLVTAYRSAPCARGCTIEIPDSVADDGSATTPTIPSNVNLKFTGGGNFAVCTIHAGAYGNYDLGNATLTLSGSHCTAISQTNVVTMQTSQKWILHGGKIDCNSQVAGTGVFVGNHTTTAIRDVNFYRCLDPTSTASAPTGGLVLFGAQFDWFDNLKFYNNYVGLKLYGLPAAGGGQSNHFNNLTVVGAGNSTTPVCVLLYEQGSTYSMGPNYFTNFTPQSCSVAAMGIIGSPAYQTITYINGGAPEVNGGGAASVTIDGVTIKQASTYQNHGFLYWTNVQLAEAKINPIVFSENNSQAIFLNPVGGTGRETFSQTDSTSASYVFGKNNAGNAVFQNASGPLLISKTAPRISSGFGSGASVTANNGPAAFLIHVGTANTGTGVIGLPSGATGWSCDATDITATTANQLVTKQTGSTSTSATLQNFANTAAAHAWTDGDVLSVHCFAY
ncbi:MAG TPA: hypothetical protein VGP19_07850 [Candidatus Acidoferrales bacterium]|jgi:hypothetical protein|nr:hypothetical protein [Candidatus Acidoferrales bacterium]